MESKGQKLLFLVLGQLSLAVGCVGIFLPFLPGTPFILVAAYCFSKGSPRLHQKILENKIFGPLILEWENYRVIRLKAKILATVFMAVFFGYTFIFVNIQWGLKVIPGFIGVGALLFIWTRPGSPGKGLQNP